MNDQPKQNTPSQNRRLALVLKSIRGIIVTHGHLAHILNAAALAFDLVGVIPDHGDRATPEEHLQRLRRLQRESQWA